jgi:hypothetical protein
VFGNSSAGQIKIDPAQGKLATGKPELEVKDAKQPKQEKSDQENELFTAWGKEVDGVQAGLGYWSGAKRAYHTGETVRLVIRV